MSEIQRGSGYREQKIIPSDSYLEMGDVCLGRRVLINAQIAPHLLRGFFSPEDPPPSARRARTFAARGKPVKRRFFLFWRHGCSAARNSSACKGKSLRCLRKSRFPYIDTSPALSARRHLTAALRPLTASLRPSRLHLGCQTHQTCSLPGINLGAVA